MENNQKLDRKWIEIRQKMDRNQIENGQELDRKWIQIRQKIF